MAHCLFIREGCWERVKSQFGAVEMMELRRAITRRDARREGQIGVVLDLDRLTHPVLSRLVVILARDDEGPFTKKE